MKLLKTFSEWLWDKTHRPYPYYGKGLGGADVSIKELLDELSAKSKSKETK